jgi:hypothetical protein
LFDDLLKFKGISTANMIGELLEDSDLRPFVEILTKFILEVKEKDENINHPNMYAMFLNDNFVHCFICYYSDTLHMLYVIVMLYMLLYIAS